MLSLLTVGLAPTVLTSVYLCVVDVKRCSLHKVSPELSRQASPAPTAKSKTVSFMQTVKVRTIHDRGSAEIYESSPTVRTSANDSDQVSLAPSSQRTEADLETALRDPAISKTKGRGLDSDEVEELRFRGKIRHWVPQAQLQKAKILHKEVTGQPLPLRALNEDEKATLRVLAANDFCFQELTEQDPESTHDSLIERPDVDRNSVNAETDDVSEDHISLPKRRDGPGQRRAPAADEFCLDEQFELDTYSTHDRPVEHINADVKPALRNSDGKSEAVVGVRGEGTPEQDPDETRQRALSQEEIAAFALATAFLLNEHDSARFVPTKIILDGRVKVHIYAMLQLLMALDNLKFDEDQYTHRQEVALENMGVAIGKYACQAEGKAAGLSLNPGRVRERIFERIDRWRFSTWDPTGTFDSDVGTLVGYVVFAASELAS